MSHPPAPRSSASAGRASSRDSIHINALESIVRHRQIWAAKIQKQMEVLQESYPDVLRAVETRRWLVRVTQNGVSAVVDPNGRMRLRLPLDQPAAATVAVSARSAITPYVRLGDVFAWLCVVVAVGCVGSDGIRSVSRPRDA